MTQLLDCCTPGSHPFDDQVLILDFRILDFLEFQILDIVIAMSQFSFNLYLNNFLRPPQPETYLTENVSRPPIEHSDNCKHVQTNHDLNSPIPNPPRFVQICLLKYEAVEVNICWCVMSGRNKCGTASIFARRDTGGLKAVSPSLASRAALTRRPT